MNRHVLLIGAPASLVWAMSCGPSEDRGPTYDVLLDYPEATTGGVPAEPSAAGASGEGGNGLVVVPPEPPAPPSVTDMKPLSGAYGSEVRITGSDLGSASRAGVALLLGEDHELDPKSKPEVVSWSETEIRFRFPFPYAGQVRVRTPQGEAIAGEFEPTWIAGTPLEVPVGTTAISSLADAPGSLAAVLDTATPTFVAYDGETWLEASVPGNNLRRDSIRLYTDAGSLLGFALSAATTPELLQLDPLDGFAQTPTGLKVTTDYRVAGAQEAATVWWRSGNDWLRARPSAGVWAGDKGPIADPNPSGADHVAGAAADGTLFVGWSEDTSTGFPEFDSLGAPMHRRLPPAATAFEAKVRTGNDMDDEISSYTMSDRGSGVVARYCGTDEDPLGLSSTDRLCFNALLPTGAKATVRETANFRYAIGPGAQVGLYCGAQGLRLLPALGAGGTTVAKLDALAGDVVAWPCPNVVALELDEEGEVLLFVEQDGKLYGPRARVR